MNELIKITALASILALATLMACGNTNSKGKVTTEQRSVGAFDKINVQGIIPVELSQDGGAERVQVVTDAKLQQTVHVAVKDGELLITTDDERKLRKATELKVYVNVKDLRCLDFNSVGTLTTNGVLKLDSLELNTNSVGKLDLNVQADFLRANLNSVGSTVLSGTVREVRINNKSIGTLKAFDLKASTLMIHNEAIGSAEVYADSAIYIRSSAIGSLRYKGTAQVKEFNISGIGKVEKVE